MLYIAIFTLFVILFGVLYAVYTFGVNRGRSQAESKWDRLKRIPICGQQLYLPGIGDVTILGQGDETIDYVVTSALKGQPLSDFHNREHELPVCSAPLDAFVAQAEISIKSIL